MTPYSRCLRGVIATQQLQLSHSMVLRRTVMSSRHMLYIQRQQQQQQQQQQQHLFKWIRHSSLSSYSNNESDIDMVPFTDSLSTSIDVQSESVSKDSEHVRIGSTTGLMTNKDDAVATADDGEDFSLTRKNKEIALPQPEGRCIGCGAELQSKNEIAPGFVSMSVLMGSNAQRIPHERELEVIYSGYDDPGIVRMPIEALKPKKSASKSICQRCSSIKFSNKSPPVAVTPNEVLRMLEDIQLKDALIVMVVDLFDFPGSVVPNINTLVGEHNSLFVIGNKLDLLGHDEGLRYSINQWFPKALQHINVKNVVGTALVSAKKFVNMKELYPRLEQARRGRDLYVVGVTNVGKTSLIKQIGFQYEIHTRSNVATISGSPGTTLDFISYPIKGGRGPFQTYLHDTPGVIRMDQMIHMVQNYDIRRLMPRFFVQPRTYILKPDQSIMLGGLGRIDYVSGDTYIMVTAFSSKWMTHRIAKTEAITRLMSPGRLGQIVGPPTLNDFRFCSGHASEIADSDYMLSFPRMRGKEYTVRGVHWMHSCVDIVLGQCGFVSVTTRGNATSVLRAFTPEGRGLCARPPLLPFAVNDRGRRVNRLNHNYEYKTRRVGHDIARIRNFHRNFAAQSRYCDVMAVAYEDNAVPIDEDPITDMARDLWLEQSKNDSNKEIDDGTKKAVVVEDEPAPPLWSDKHLPNFRNAAAMDVEPRGTGFIDRERRRRQREERSERRGENHYKVENQRRGENHYKGENHRRGENRHRDDSQRRDDNPENRPIHRWREDQRAPPSPEGLDPSSFIDDASIRRWYEQQQNDVDKQKLTEEWDGSEDE